MRHQVEVIRGLGLGGAETLLVDRLSVTRCDPNRSVAVVNAHPDEGHFKKRLDDCDIPVTHLSSPNPIINAWRLWQLAASWPTESIVVTHSPAPALVLKLRTALRGRRYVLVDVVHNARFRKIYLWLSRPLNRFADHAIFVSQDVASGPSARGFRSGEVVHGGVDRQRMLQWRRDTDDARARLRAEIFCGADDVVVTFVANFRSSKNHDLVLDVAKLLPEDWTLVMIGQGPEYQRISDRITNESIRNVRLLGRRPNAWQWIAVSDAILHASHWEGLPVALMEAAALQVPTVTTDFQGSREAAPHASNFNVVTDGTPAKVARAVLAAVQEGALARHVSRSATDPGSYWDLARFRTDFDDALERAWRRARTGAR